MHALLALESTYIWNSTSKLFIHCYNVNIQYLADMPFGHFQCKDTTRKVTDEMKNIILQRLLLNFMH